MVVGNTIDFASLAAELSSRAEALVADWLPGGRRDGHEWRCGSLSGDEGDSCAVNIGQGIARGRWSDFATGEGGGDLISLYAAIHGLSMGAAARQICADLAITQNIRPVSRPAAADSGVKAMPEAEKRRSDWQTLVPVPDFAPPPPTVHAHRGAPETVWQYRRDGQMLGLVCRFRTSDGGKEVLPLTWCVNNHDTAARGAMRWHWKVWDAPRPLYLAGGTLRPGMIKAIVEGEKCATALHGVLGEQFDAISWPGGGKAVGLADWSWIAGEKVILWPDADSHRRRLTEAEKQANVLPDNVDYLPADKQPGAAAMLKLAEKLAVLGCEVWMCPLTPPGTLPDGWDCADAIAGIGVDAPWGADALQAYLRTAKRWEAPNAVINEAARIADRAAKSASTPTSATAGKDGAAVDVRGWPHYGKDGPKATRENMLHAMRRDPALIGLCGLNEFSHQVYKLRPTPWESASGVWSEVDDLMLGEYVVNRHDWAGSPSHETITQALRVVAHENRFHPVRERFEAFVWDRTPRLESWLFEALGLEVVDMPTRQIEYIKHVGKWFLMGMVRRVMQPGCKWDYMLVLEGPQGYRKSSLGKVLAGDYFSDTHLNLGDKDSYLQLQGRLLHEFSELHSLSGKDVTLVKAFLTATTDYVRAPFDKRPAEYPRQCVFFGTSNNGKWARDRTGNRRFWPVEVVNPIDTEWVEANLDQLFAEAVHRVKAGERSYPTHEEERRWFMPEQAQRVQSTATEEALLQFLLGERDKAGGNKEVVPPTQVTLVSCLEGIGIDVAKSASNRMVQSEVIELLHKWGWKHQRSSKKVAGGGRPWFYMRPAVFPPQDEFSADDDLPTPQTQAGVPESDDDVPF